MATDTAMGTATTPGRTREPPTRPAVRSELPGTGPVDMDLSDSDGFLYVFNRAGGSISAFAVNGDGSLTAVAGASAIPTTGNGIVAI